MPIHPASSQEERCFVRLLITYFESVLNVMGILRAMLFGWLSPIQTPHPLLCLGLGSGFAVYGPAAAHLCGLGHPARRSLRHGGHEQSLRGRCWWVSPLMLASVLCFVVCF